MQKNTPARLVRGSGKSSRRQRRITDAVLETLERRQLLTTYVVDKVVDLDDGDYNVGELTLREAVNLANANVGADVINFNVAAANPTFLLFAGALNITESLSIDGTNLNGAGGIATVNGQATGAVMNVNVGTTVGVADIHLRNGKASTGGGILNAGNLTLNNTVVTASSATLSGGGIYNTGTLIIQGGTVISTNVASSTGGGIHNAGGTVSISSSSLTGNAAGVSGVGGGIYNNGGSLTLTSSTISAGGATDGAGIYSTGSGTVALSSSTVSNNSSVRFGGGIFNTGTSSVAISNSSISGNSTGVTGSGGGIYTLSGTVSVSGSTISNNRTQGPNGGGVRNAGILTLTDTTIAGNTSNAAGGGIYSISSGSQTTLLRSTVSGNTSETSDGGGIATTSSSVLKVINSTISGNTAARGGGGLHAFSGTVTVTNTTITNNRADSDNNATGVGGGLRMEGSGPTVTMNNTIVADNYVGPGVVEDDIQVSAGALSGSNNLVGTGGSGGLVDGVSGNKVGVANPLLGALANNGGSTQTHALLQNSLARQGGNNGLALDASANPLTTDQTGGARIIDSIVDIGSYEASPFTFIVDKLVDLNDGDYSVGELTLREAVLLSNANPGTDTINFNVAAANPTFLLFAGALNVTNSVVIDGTNLNGLGGTATVNGQATGGVMDVASGITVNVADMQMRNGRRANGGGILNNGNLTLNNVVVTANSATTSGGGIYNTGTLTITGGSIVSTNNASLTGGGIHNQPGSTIVINAGSSLQTNTTNATGLGGGIYNTNGSVTLTSATITGGSANDGAGIYNTVSGSLALTSSTISNNNALRSGGGIYNTGTATVTANNATISGNSSGATGGGGGIFNLTGTVTLNTSTLSNNRTTGSNGGGIRNAAQLSINNTTVAGNISAGAGGGIYTTGASSKTTVVGSTISGNQSQTGDGGGVESTLSAPTRIVNSTVSGNVAARHGGGIHIFTGTLTLTNTTITNNRSDNDDNADGLGGGVYMDLGGPTVNMSNTIVADNFVGTGAVENDIVRTAGTLNAFNNLIGTGGSGGVVHGVNGNQVGIANPMIGALANNGGLTQTHALLAGSPAIHSGDSTLAVHPDSGIPFPTDQRGVGFPRFLGPHVDIGSIEANVPLTLVVDKLVDLDDGDYGTGELAMREAVKLANENAGLDTIIVNVAALNPTFNIFGGALALTDNVVIDGTNLNGLGGVSTINAQNNSLVFSVAGGVTATIQDFTLRNGRSSLGGGINNAGNLTLTNVLLTLNTATLNGGGIYNTGSVTLDGGTSVSNGNASTTGAGVYNLGTLIMSNATIQGNIVNALGIGGGIYNPGGIINATNSTITANTSTDGAGIYNLSGGSVTLTNSTVSNNSATRFGAGIFNTGSGTLTITNSQITGNSSGASGAGGGVYSLSGTVTISGSTISNNRTTGSDGGGIRNAGTLVVTNSTISGNIAQAGGGGIYSTSSAANVRILNSTISGNTTVTGDGGGLLNTSASIMRLINSTVSGNASVRGGGGIHGFSGTIIITNSTITNNRADSDNNATGVGGGIRMEGSGPTVTLNNSIVADNFVGPGAIEDDIQRTTGTLTGSSNLIGTGGSGGLVNAVSGNQVGVANPMLGLLASNGGPTQTHLLLPGSTAIDLGNNALAVDHLAAPLGTDQRGNQRIGNSTVDIGAVEFTINLNGAATTNEGATYSLTIGPVVDNSAVITDYRIDWGDGNVQTVTALALAGMANVVTHVYVDDNPTATASDPYTISLDVMTAATSPTFVDANFKNITVNNVNPVVTLNGATPNGLVGTPVNMTGTFTDAGALDTITNWSWDVSKNGVSLATQSGLGTSFSYTPTSPGHYVVSLTATDDDTGATTVRSTIHVSGAQIQTDPTDALKTALFVYGTAGNDTINITKLGVSLVRVQLNGVIIGTFAPTGRVIVQGGTGNDNITDSTVVQHTIMYGGEGDDTITTNGADDILVGGNGNDNLVGGNGDDVLIGGDGADSMNGGADEDLLIGGSTSYDAATLSNMNSLKNVQVAWSTLGAAGVAPLLLGNVTDDAFADSMTGGTQNDLFYADSVLDITDAVLGDTTVAI